MTMTTTERTCANCGDRVRWHVPACSLCKCEGFAAPHVIVDITEAGRKQAAISQWLDDSTFYEDLRKNPAIAVVYAQLMFRVHKIAEEYGEVQEAIIGAAGENPRKGISNGWDKVEKELFDVAGAALGAIEHLRGNDGSSIPDLIKALEGVHKRAGL
jgi:hypothetical protein